MKTVAFHRIRSIANFVQDVLARDPMLPVIEKKILSKRRAESNNVQPIFIVGAPRTGSTLLFELLISTYRMSYVTNFSALFFKTPAFAIKLQNRLRLCHQFSGRSEYGYVPGLAAPSEAGVLFKRWFGNGDEIQPSAGDLLPAERVRATVAAISETMGGPFISKNLNNSLRVGRIHSVFPDAVYLFMRRDPVYTAQSIIVARRRLFDDDRQWFSVKPPNYRELADLEPFAQVVSQIKSIEDGIRTMFDKRQIVNRFEIEYEALCGNWERVLEQTAESCRHAGVRLGRRKQSPVVSLKKSQRQLLNDIEWKKLILAVDERYSKRRAKGQNCRR
jgi:LPS sulfotransferase NodH